MRNSAGQKPEYIIL